MNSKFIILLSLILINSPAIAQAPDTLWVKYYSSGLNSDIFFSVGQTVDGGFVASGWADDDVVAVKTDINGDTMWTFRYDQPGYNYAGRQIKQTADSGYIIIGETGNPSQYWLCKLDSEGIYEWDKLYGGDWSEFGQSVDQTSDGGYIVIGYSQSFSTTHKRDIWILRTDAFGDTLWTKVFGGLDEDFGYSVQETSDGGFILGGRTSSYGAGASDIWIIKLNADGDTLWTKLFGGANYDECREVEQTKDGGYIILGYTLSFGAGSYDTWLIKTDSLGNTQWAKTFGGNYSERCYSVDELENGGYVFSGITTTSNDVDMYIVRTDSLGNELWSRHGISVLMDAAYSIEQTFDGGFIVAGYVHKYATLMRLAPENLLPSVTILSPNGGEELIIDSEYTITWNSNGIDSLIIDYTADNGVSWMTVISSLPANTGSYLWTVPNTPSYQCKVRISDKSNSLTSDISNEVFTIRSLLSSTIEILSPNGREELTPETNFSITWNSTNVIDVKIELSINNGASWTVLVDSCPSSGLYNWLVSNTPSIQSLIKITNLIDATAYDISDSLFTIKDISDVEEYGLPDTYELFDNYPNPFNPSTKIKYSVPQISKVHIKVYDVLGDEIATLVDEEKPAGEYEVQFNAANLPSGIYFYLLKAGAFVETKKMILIK